MEYKSVNNMHSTCAYLQIKTFGNALLASMSQKQTEPSAHGKSVINVQFGVPKNYALNIQIHRLLFGD